MQTPPRGLMLVFLASLAAVVWGAYGPFLLSPGPHHSSVTPVNMTLRFSYGFLWVLVTAITYRRDPAGRMWKLMLLSSIATGTWVLGYIQTDLTWTAAEFLAPLGLAILVHLGLAFPTGRLRDRFDLALIALGYGVVLPLQFVELLFFDPILEELGCTGWCPRNVLLLVRNDDLAFGISQLGGLLPVVSVLAIGELIRHWRSASQAGRRALAPVAFGMPPLLVILAIWWVPQELAYPIFDVYAVRDFMSQNKIFDLPSFLTPSLFLLGILRTRFARGNIA